MIIVQLQSTDIITLLHSVVLSSTVLCLLAHSICLCSELLAASTSLLFPLWLLSPHGEAMAPCQHLLVRQHSSKCADWYSCNTASLHCYCTFPSLPPFPGMSPHHGPVSAGALLGQLLAQCCPPQWKHPPCGPVAATLGPFPSFPLASLFASRPCLACMHYAVPFSLAAASFSAATCFCAMRSFLSRSSLPDAARR